MQLNEDNIDDAFFLKNNDDKVNEKKTMVVKFDNKKSKDKLMMCKAKLGNTEDTKNIFIGDYLRKECLNLLHYMKSLKSIGYIHAYTRGSQGNRKMQDLCW